jgi:hypothetical protein
MNERIGELANIWANRRRKDPDLGIVFVFTEKALEAYSEKIVEECCNIVLHYTDVDEGVAVAKKHFGII